MRKKYKEEKRVFEKYKQKPYRNEQKNSHFFKIEFWQKKAPAGRRSAKKKKFLKNIGKGDIKKGLHQRIM